ncbi:MAG: M28 family peptidase [Lentimicrobiaceae bacterium]|nr:M28 family peptidase [Lentimicrobiaceae bacterium]
MKKSTFPIKKSHFLCTLLFTLLSFNICAQATLINNKGNRNQSYPVITQPKQEIVQLINQVNQSNIESSIRYMQQFFRVAKSPEALIVQNWLIDRFESYGYDVDDISIHFFNMQGTQLEAGNVVVVKKGTEFPDEYIMITSHYDHSTYDIAVGPGADDNASGTSGVLECARLLKNIPTKRSILFVPFNAEEYWMVGSLPFAKKCAEENMNIIAHFNMDMIGWFPPDNPNTLMASGYSNISKALFEYYHQTANIYVPSIPTIRLSEGDSYGGDHMPFNMYEYPSLYIGDIEYHSQHPCYHQMCDTIGPYQVGVKCGVNRLDLAKAFVQAVLASSTELANAWLPPQNLSACSGIDKIKVSWDNNSESSSYKLFRNGAFVGETADNFYEDQDVELGNKYEYYVIAVHKENGQESAPSFKDEVTFVTPLQLPYFNDFTENRHGFEQSNWVIKTISNKTSLCNTAETVAFPDNYLSIAELDWFPIPENTENIAIRFKWADTIRGIWYNARLFFEVTNDRKTWHKLAQITGDNPNWVNCEISLNQFINSDFFQARFRLESSGAQSLHIKKGYITDIEIDYVLGEESIKELPSYFSTFNVTPNPADTFINIITNQQTPYHVAIYDLTGKIVFAQAHFNDGMLDVASLQKGIYFVVASTQGHRVAKKVVIQ